MRVNAIPIFERQHLYYTVTIVMCLAYLQGRPPSVFSFWVFLMIKCVEYETNDSFIQSFILLIFVFLSSITTIQLFLVIYLRKQKNLCHLCA